jgi:hypothetical protein
MPEQGRFSERIGVNPIRTVLQVASMDAALRNYLWNLLTIHCWNKLGEWSPGHPSTCQRADVFFRLVWILFLKWPLDEKPDNHNRALKVLREQFFQWKWYEVYDFIEFTSHNYPFGEGQHDSLLADLNFVLESELLAIGSSVAS